jgi:hypothetical protein
MSAFLIISLLFIAFGVGYLAHQLNALRRAQEALSKEINRNTIMLRTIERHVTHRTTVPPKSPLEDLLAEAQANK